MDQEEGNLPKLVKPALRTLAGSGITRLGLRGLLTEEEVMQLHGMGPKTIESILCGS